MSKIGQFTLENIKENLSFGEVYLSKEELNTIATATSEIVIEYLLKTTERIEKQSKRNSDEQTRSMIQLS